MQQTKVIRILTSLSVQERNRFHRFVHSPFFHVHQPTINFWEAIREYLAQPNTDELDRERVFEKVFPGEAFHDPKLGTLRNNLLRLLYQFLAVIEMEAKPAANRLALLTQLYERKQLALLPALLNQGFQELEEQAGINGEKLYAQFRLREFAHGVGIQGDNRSPNLDGSGVTNRLDAFYLCEKLRYSCAMVNRAMVLSLELDERPIRILEEIYPQFAPEKEPLASAYFQILQLLMEKDSSPTFTEVWEWVKRFESSFMEDDLINMYGFLISYSNYQYRQGKMEYIQHTLDLYKSMLRLGLLFESYMLSSVHYRNMVSLGLMLREFNWTKEFIHTYKDSIDPPFREAAFNHNLARFYFTQKNYRKALAHLRDVELLDSFDKLSNKQLLLKTYYEVSDTDGFFPLVTTFRTYLRRNRSISGAEKEAYTNLLIFTRELFYIKSEKRPIDLDQLTKKIEACKALVDRTWLMEKIKEIRITQ
ncbi:MAG: hypothetical protein AAF206_31150 [Bacteroidota bacterium]